MFIKDKEKTLAQSINTEYTTKNDNSIGESQTSEDQRIEKIVEDSED